MSPADAGELIGRQDDVAALLASLERPGLVCVVGAAGVGKSTLARQVAVALGEAGREVAWCDASAGAGPLALVLDAARAVGVALPAKLSLDGALRGAARALDGDRVLVLDDLDLRAAPLAGAVRELSRLAPRLCILATARGSGGADRVHRVRPLALSPRAEGVLESECGRAWQRFVQRRGGRPVAGREESALLWEILAELDGLPLAIELAAARASVLSSAEILRALRRDRFELLRSEEGHTTAALERAIAASWSALGEPERRLLEVCSLFAAGFSIALLERVTDEPHLYDVLSRLVDPSLVTRAHDRGERAWFVLPSSVRAFAARELDRRGDRAARTTRLRKAYADELDALTARPADRLRTNAQLEDERENLLELTSHTSPADAESTLRILAALQGFYWTEGLTDAQLATLETALAHAEDASPLTIARALAFRGRVRRRRGDPSAEADLRRAIAVAGAAHGEVAALAGRELGWLLIARGRFEECDAVLTSAAASVRESPYADAWILLVRAQLDRHHGRLDLGRERASSAMLTFRRLQARFDETLALLEISEQCLMTGEHDRARQTSESGFALASEMGASGASLAANFLVMLAAARLEAGDYAGSMDAVDQARARARALDDTVMETAASAVEVLVHWGSGAIDVARAVVSRVIPDLGLRGDRIWGGFFVALEGAMAAERDHEVEAETALARAARDFPAASTYRAAIRLCTGHLELLRARRALDAGKSKEATHHLNVAIATAAAARAPGPEGTLSDSARLFETRLVLRVLDEAIARFTSASATPPAASRGTLAIEREAEWLLADGTRVSLAKRPVLRKLLLELARERIAHPGVALSADHLIAVGWPGERILYSSAVSRLRMAISRLRAVGLASMLRTEGDGYYLDETVRVSFVDE